MNDPFQTTPNLTPNFIGQSTGYNANQGQQVDNIAINMPKPKTHGHGNQRQGNEFRGSSMQVG